MVNGSNLIRFFLQERQTVFKHQFLPFRDGNNVVGSRRQIYFITINRSIRIHALHRISATGIACLRKGSRISYRQPHSPSLGTGFRFLSFRQVQFIFPRRAIALSYSCLRLFAGVHCNILVRSLHHRLFCRPGGALIVYPGSRQQFFFPAFGCYLYLLRHQRTVGISIACRSSSVCPIKRFRRISLQRRRGHFRQIVRSHGQGRHRCVPHFIRHRTLQQPQTDGRHRHQQHRSCRHRPPAERHYPPRFCHRSITGRQFLLQPLPSGSRQRFGIIFQPILYLLQPQFIFHIIFHYHAFCFIHSRTFVAKAALARVSCEADDFSLIPSS